MPERKPAKKTTGNATKGTGLASKKGERFSDEELGAMKDRVQEMKAGRASKGDGEGEVLAKIAAMQGTDREMAERLHALIKGSVPTLSPKTWYGMPAYAKDGQIICFFQNSRKFKTRYSTLGFSDKAKLDDGNMWPSAFALKELTADEEKRIVALVKRALG